MADNESTTASGGITEPQSRVEKILAKTIQQYDGDLEEPQSRIEILLLALNEYISEISGGSGSSVVPDWNEKDETAAGYIKNKPPVMQGGNDSAVIMGTKRNYATGTYSFAQGAGCDASGNYSHAQGSSTEASAWGAHAEGEETVADADNSHAEGLYAYAKGACSHAEGVGTIAAGGASHAAGKYNIEDTSKVYAEIIGNGSSDEKRSNARTLDWQGNEVLAGKLTVGVDPAEDMDVATRKYVDEKAAQPDWEETDENASGYIKSKPPVFSDRSGTSVIEGSTRNSADGSYCHAEGEQVKASGNYCHAEGTNTSAGGYASHAEGSATSASMYCSHAEGEDTNSKAVCSHAEGIGTIASGEASHVSGKYNIEDEEDTYAEIIGNGTEDDNRSNARTLDWQGNEVLAGKLTVGADPSAEYDVATKKYVDGLIAGLQEKIDALTPA